MRKLYAQGDVLIERVDAAPEDGTPIARDPDGAVVLARGEITGHRHAIYGSPNVAMFRDDALARAMPNLYIGNLKIVGDGVVVKHEEHAPIDLPPGDYVVRQQRRHVIAFNEAGEESAAVEAAID